MKGEIKVANDKGKQENRIIEKIFVKNKKQIQLFLNF